MSPGAYPFTRPGDTHPGYPANPEPRLLAALCHRENRTKRVCENSGAKVVRVTIRTRGVLLMLHSGPAATLKSLESAYPLKHAPPPPLYEELRGWKRGVDP